MWNLLTISPQDFKGGTIWTVIQSVHGTLQATGLALLVLLLLLVYSYCTAGVLRRPNASFYLSMVLALVYYLTRIKVYPPKEERPS